MERADLKMPIAGLHALALRISSKVVILSGIADAQYAMDRKNGIEGRQSYVE